MESPKELTEENELRFLRLRMPDVPAKRGTNAANYWQHLSSTMPVAPTTPVPSHVARAYRNRKTESLDEKLQRLAAQAAIRQAAQRANAALAARRRAHAAGVPRPTRHRP